MGVQEQNVILKMPKGRNAFTGRVTFSALEFETAKGLVDKGHIRIICDDGFVKLIAIEAWMIEDAEWRSSGAQEYVLFTYSKSVYKKDLANEKRFGGR